MKNLTKILLIILACIFISCGGKKDDGETEEVVTEEQKEIEDGVFDENGRLLQPGTQEYVDARRKQILLKQEEAAKADLENRLQQEVDRIKSGDLYKGLIGDLEVFNTVEDLRVLATNADETRFSLGDQVTYSFLIKEGEKSDNKKVQSLAKTLKQELSKLQVKYFPQLRKKYLEITKNNLWKQDFDLKWRGSKFDNVAITNAIFVRNANIDKFHTEIRDIFYLFRIKEVGYLWYDEQDDYTYYTLKSLADNEIK